MTVNSVLSAPLAGLAVTERLLPVVTAHHTSASPASALLRPARAHVKPPPVNVAAWLPTAEPSVATHATATCGTELATLTVTAAGPKPLTTAAWVTVGFGAHVRSSAVADWLITDNAGPAQVT